MTPEQQQIFIAFILFMVVLTALGFGWGWIIRSIQEKDKKGGE